MMECIYCGAETNSMVFIQEHGAYGAVCHDCARRKRKERIEESLGNVENASDFSSWKKEDMSEAFWIHLIEYQKCPNKHSLNVMQTAFLWACHDDHGLSNSFAHALDWCGIDFFEERLKELPEK